MRFDHIEVMVREDGSGAHSVVVYRCCPPSCDNSKPGHGCFFGRPVECRMYLKIHAAKTAWFAHECLPGIYSHRKRRKHLHKKFRKSFIDNLIGVA